MTGKSRASRGSKKHTTILNVASVKGGTGKSVLSLALAIRAAREWNTVGRTIYLDADFSGTCTRAGLGGNSTFTRKDAASKPFRYLEDLFNRISPHRPDGDVMDYFERFEGQRLGEKLYMAFSGQNHREAYAVSRLLDVEQETHLVLTRLLKLAGHGMEGCSSGLIILDNGPGIYGISQEVTELHQNIDDFLDVNGLRHALGGTSILHLFVATPDRQDLDGTADLLHYCVSEYQRNTENRKGSFPCFVAVNCSRRGWTPKEIEARRPELLDRFRGYLPHDQWFSVLGDYECLRLFTNPSLGGAALWDDAEWSRHEDQLDRLAKDFFEPIREAVTPS